MGTARRRQNPVGTPDMGTAAAGLRSTARHPNLLHPSEQSSPNYEQRGQPPPITMSPYIPWDPSSWSPPPPSKTPTPPRTISPMSAQSVLAFYHHGSPWGLDDDGMDYRNSSSGPGTGDSAENPSMLCVRSRQANRGHVLTRKVV